MATERARRKPKLLRANFWEAKPSVFFLKTEISNALSHSQFLATRLRKAATHGLDRVGAF